MWPHLLPSATFLPRLNHGLLSPHEKGPLPQGHQSPQQKAPVSSTLPRYMEALPPAHTYMHTACARTLTHMHTHAGRHILCQARCPPQSQVSAVPSPGKGLGPPGTAPSPISGPLGWGGASG